MHAILRENGAAQKQGRRKRARLRAQGVRAAYRKRLGDGWTGKGACKTHAVGWQWWPVSDAGLGVKPAEWKRRSWRPRAADFPVRRRAPAYAVRGRRIPLCGGAGALGGAAASARVWVLRLFERIGVLTRRAERRFGEGANA